MAKETSEVDVIINNQRAFSSIKEMEKALRELKAVSKSTEDVGVRQKAIEQYQQLNKQVQEYNTQLKGTKSLTDKLADGFKSFGIAAGLTLGAHEIINFGKESFKAFAEAEEHAIKLKVAVGVNGGLTGAYKELMEQSAQLQKTTIFSDDDVQMTQTMALQFGLTTRQVKELLPVITDFASATGQDLSSALEAVLRGVEGNGRGLKLYGIEVDSTATKAENLTSMTEALNKKFKGQADILGTTTIGEMKKLGNAWDDLKEQIGGAAIKIADSIALAFYAATDIDKYYKLRLREGMKKTLEDQQKTDEIFRVAYASKLTEWSIKDLKNRETLLTNLQAKYTEEKNTEKLRQTVLSLQVIQSELTQRTLLEEQHAKKTTAAKKEAIKKDSEDFGKIELEQDLKNLDLWSNQQKTALANQRAEGEISEDEYQKRLLDIQKKYLMLKIFNLKQYNKDASAEELALAENAIKSNELSLNAFKDSLKDKRKYLQYETEALSILLLTGVSITGESVEQMLAHIKNLTGKTGDSFRDMMKNVSKYVNMFGGQLSTIFSSLNKIQDNKGQAFLDSQKRQYDKDLHHYQELLRLKLITQAKYDKKVNELNEKKDKDERKVQHDTAVRNKKAGYFNAVIHTAEGVANALTLPWPLNLIMAALVGAAGAVEIAEIASTPIPELGRGKKFSGIGKHPQSTQKVSDPSGSVFHVEEDEVLLSAATAAKNPIVDDLLQASLNNNGELPQVNTNQISNTTRQLRQSFGSAFSDPGSLDGHAVVNRGNSVSGDVARIMSSMYEVLNDLRNNGIEARLHYAQLKRDTKRLDTITGQS